MADVLAANERRRRGGRGTLDEGALDRLRLDEPRVATLARQLEATAALEPLEREIASRTLANGLRCASCASRSGRSARTSRRGRASPLDIAAQVLKSLNTVVLRTGGAALATVEALVDQVLRPALEAEGIDPGAVGLVRSPDRAGAEALVSLPRWIPLVILRGSGASTAALARLAADNGVRTLAHAEGGGVLYVHGSAARRSCDGDRRRQPRPARRLQPAQPRARRSGGCRPGGQARRGLRGARRRGGRNRPCDRRRQRAGAGRADRPRVGERPGAGVAP